MERGRPGLVGGRAQWRVAAAHRHDPARAQILPHNTAEPIVLEVLVLHKLVTLNTVQVRQRMNFDWMFYVL